MRRTSSVRTCLPAVLPVLCLALAGCLEREETITVEADGAVEVTHVIHGDGGDLDGGAAALPTGGPWESVRSTRVKKDGKLEHVLTARARFAPGAQLPADFAPDPAARATALAAPTDLEVRREAGRTVYTFARTYRARAWAPFQFVWNRAFPKQVQALFEGAKDLPGMDPERRRRLLRAVIDHEQGKLWRWADAALQEVTAPSPARTRARLAVRGALARAVAEQLPLEEVERLVLEHPERIEARTQELQASLERAAAEAATLSLRWTPAEEAAFSAALERRRRAFEVTEDLGDETFVVRLRLPGRVVAHDADAVEEGALVWRFGGQDLRDRDHSLLAVSALEDAD